jgi:hypothetical protein
MRAPRRTARGSGTAVAGSPAGRLTAAVGLLVGLAAGVLVLGRLVPSAGAAVVATSIWFVLVAVVVLAVGRRRRHLLVPLTAAYAVVGLGAAALLGRPLVLDRTVEEEVVSAAPAPMAALAAPPAGPAPSGNRPVEATGPVELASGRFERVAHDGRGRAAVVRLADGSYRVTLTDFATDNGPDLRVRLVVRDPADGDGENVVDLGALKGNRGNQQYVVPKQVDPTRFGSVVVWCRAFSVAFVQAPLAAS